ncbi:EF-hand, partial [Backusella circina FSU 941]
TDADIAYLKNKFESLTNGGNMTYETLKEVYRTAKIDISDDEIRSQQHDKDAEAGVTKVFEMLDTDGDGLISGDDLKRGVSLFGNSVTEADIKEMLASADVDGDGMINYEEFLKVMTPSKVNGQSLF